jgi:hypothetical protein
LLGTHQAGPTVGREEGKERATGLRGGEERDRERRGGGLKMHNFIRPWYVKLRERLIVDRNEKSHDVLVRVFHAMMSFD